LGKGGVVVKEETENCEQQDTLICDYNEELLKLCQDKSEEFFFFGYEHIQAKDIFMCAKSITHKNERLHEMVGAILSLRINQFMNYETMNAYKGIME